MTEDADVLLRLMQARYSCRAFLPDPVPQDTVNSVLRIARHTASWNNTQPWQALITRGAETDAFRKTLLEEVKSGKPGADLPWPDAYPDALGERRRTCGYALYNAVGIAREDRAARAAQSMRNFSLFDAPHVAILHTPKVLGGYGALDASGFLTACMLAATAQGLGTIAQAAVAAYPNVIRSHFGLSEDRMILCAISFGFADTKHPVNAYRTEREDIADIATFIG